MLVGQIMSQKIITISPDKTRSARPKLMQKHQIRHVPVMEHDRMVGGSPPRDLREVLPGLHAGRHQGRRRDGPGSPQRHPRHRGGGGGRLIHEHKIGGMPVMEGDKLVGVITMLDLISAFIAMLGLLKSSSRLDLLLPNRSEAWMRPPASSRRRGQGHQRALGPPRR